MVSSSGPRVKFVTTSAPTTAIDTVYGFVPPVVVSPKGSQASRLPVTFDVSMILSVGAFGRQLASSPYPGQH